jgi:hypothetical protein
MKKILLVILLSLLPSLVFAQTNNCNNPQARINTVVNISTATTTRLINNTTTQRPIVVCNFTLTVVGTATANTLTFITGTGATCGTGTSTISGPYTGAATAGVVIALTQIMPFGVLVTGDSLCLTTSQAGVVAGNLVYILN